MDSLIGVGAIWLVMAGLVGSLASSRGRSGIGYFVLSAVMSPLLGLIVVMVTRDLVRDAEEEKRRKLEHEKQVEAIRAASTAPSQAPAMATASPAGHMVADELEKLIQLRDRGHLTPDEFQAQRQKLLGTL